MMPDPTRITIYVTPLLARALDNRAIQSGQLALRSRSAAVATIADRYDEILRRAMPTFGENEWRCIFDALNGVWTREPASALASVWAEVDDALELNHFDEKWGLPDRSLGQRIRALPFASLVALVDAVERYWATEPHDHHRDALSYLVGDEHIAEE